MIDQKTYNAAWSAHVRAEGEVSRTLDELSDMLANARWAADLIHQLAFDISETSKRLTREDLAEVQDALADLKSFAVRFGRVEAVAARLRYVPDWQEVTDALVREHDEQATVGTATAGEEDGCR